MRKHAVDNKTAHADASSLDESRRGTCAPMNGEQNPVHDCVHDSGVSVATNSDTEPSSTEAVARAFYDVPLIERSLPFYYFSPKDSEELTLYFEESCPEIPYISAKDARRILEAILLVREDNNARITETEKDGVLRWSRENGSAVQVDFSSRSILFDRFNWFTQPSYAATALDMFGISGLNPAYHHYMTDAEGSTETEGDPIWVNLRDYGIRLIYNNGSGYLPLQTFSDLFLSSANTSIIYNGKMAAVVLPASFSAFKELYYEVPPSPRSEHLAQFTYNELCLALDLYYGLKREHGLGAFDAYLQRTNLAKKMLSTDAADADKALADLCYGYLGDAGTAIIGVSPYAGMRAHASMLAGVIASRVYDYYTGVQTFALARNEAFPDGIPVYEEVGNTAFVTPLTFHFPDPEPDYQKCNPGPDSKDTVGLIMYAHRQIMRNNSPVENVVLDLSGYVGGDVLAAIYIMGWFLGGRAVLNLSDTLTGVQTSTAYQVDVNGDGIFDVWDSITTKNLYCLISPATIGAAGMLAAAFGASGYVTLLGQRTASAGRFARTLSLADGTLCTFPGPWVMNGTAGQSGQDPDRGVEPQVILAEPADFYDRKAVMEHLESQESLR